MTFTRRDPLFADIFTLHGKWRRHDEAVICGDQRLNWGELDARLNQVARAAHEAGLEPGDRAAVLMTNGLPMLEVLFGLIKAGVTSVPLNLSVSEDALAGMIQDSGAKAIFTSPDQAARIEGDPHLKETAQGLLKIVAGEAAGWQSFEAWWTGQSSAPLTLHIDPETPLNIIYSSGTTGLPKGIVQTQRGRKNWASDLCVALRYHGRARTLITIGMYSNISWVSLLCTALAGGTLIIEPGFDVARFWDVVETEGVSHSSMVPLQFSKILEGAPEGDVGSSFKALMSAGSPLYPELKQALLERFGPVIFELYGLTEGVITTLDPEAADDRLSSVGQPLTGTDICILGDDDQILPDGEAGEIVATGRIVMPAYWNRPEQTAEASWTAPDDKVWLRTGDIGYVDASGYLYIVDRKKDMILSGGQNIYPHDIEEKLIAHPDIAEAAVIGAKSRKWGETPIGLVVLKRDAEMGALLDWCNERLGKQQRLADVLAIDSLPRNPNGKILKRELRKAYSDRVYH